MRDQPLLHVRVNRLAVNLQQPFEVLAVSISGKASKFASIGALRFMAYLGDKKQAAKSGTASELGSVAHEANRRIAFPDLTFDQLRTVVCRAVVVAPGYLSLRLP